VAGKPLIIQLLPPDTGDELTAVRIFSDVPGFGINDRFDKQSQVVIMRKKSVEMGKLVPRISKPLSATSSALRGINTGITYVISC